MHEDEASRLWRLAGYQQTLSQDGDTNAHDDGTIARATILVLAPDPRVMYSDGVQVTASNSGVVVTFTQNNGVPNALTTARIGMSREQAQSVIHALQEALAHSIQYRLPNTNPKNKSDDKNQQ